MLNSNNATVTHGMEIKLLTMSHFWPHFLSFTASKQASKTVFIWHISFQGGFKKRQRTLKMNPLHRRKGMFSVCF